MIAARRIAWRCGVKKGPHRPFKRGCNSNPAAKSTAKLGWIERSPFLPNAIKPYLLLARLDKPVGIWLLLWPCVWSTALAAPHALPDPTLLAQYAVGASIMRGAGCTINDILDQKYDRDVERTKSRPLASGAVTTKGKHNTSKCG